MQIRVRAWHKTQKRMYYPEELGMDQLTLMPNGRGFVNVHGSDTRLSQIDDDRTMVPLLSTGLRDKHGHEVYEGDVLKIPAGYSGDYWEEEKLRVVEWGSGDNEHDVGFYLSAPGGICWSDCEIVGNIYENPDILKGEG